MNEHSAPLPPIRPTPKQDPLMDDDEAVRAVIASERAEADRVRALGPEPPVGVTQEQLENNPSDYRPAIEAREAMLDEETGATYEEHRRQLAAARRAMIEEETPVTNPSVATEQAQPAVRPRQPEPEDTRQLWVCVGLDGIRSMTAGVVHPAFHSDANVLGRLVECPNCAKTTVRKVIEGENLDAEEERARWANASESERLRLSPVLRR